MKKRKKKRIAGKRARSFDPRKLLAKGLQLPLSANFKPAKRDQFILMANTGKPMRVGGYPFPVVVDLEASSFDKDRTPVLVDHDTARRMGHTVEQIVIPAGQRKTIAGQVVKGPMIVALAIRSSTMRLAKNIVDDMREGFPFQVSIGADPEGLEFIDEDEEVRVNGRVWKGPLLVATPTKIREISVTVLGADSDTSATIAARRAVLSTLSWSARMKFSDWLRSKGLNAKRLDAETLQTLKLTWQSLQRKKTVGKTVKASKRVPIKATRKRIKAKVDVGIDQSSLDDITRRVNETAAQAIERQTALSAVVAQFPDVKAKVKIKGEDGKTTEQEMNMNELHAHAIRSGWDADTLELHCRRGDYPQVSGNVPAIHLVNKDFNRDALVCSILRSYGTPSRDSNKVTKKDYGIETMFKQEVLEASHLNQYRITCMDDLLALQIRAAGRHPNALRGTELLHEAFRAYTAIQASGFSTLSLTNILEDVANKAAQASWQAAENVWPFICGRKNLNDFKIHKLYRLDFDGAVRKVAADGELKHVSMKDLKKTIQADTYGAMISVDRKTRVDDDLGMVIDKARGITVMVAQRLEESVFVLLLSNPGSFFAAGNNNLLTGGTSALSITSLDSARLLFRNQVVNGKPVSNGPRFILVGTGLETLANNLYGEDRLSATGNTDQLVFTRNPHKGLYRPYVSPWLNNTGILDQDGKAITGQSATQWYLGSDPNAPQGSAIVIGFLNGRDTPYFDSADTQFNIPGGIQMRTYMDWGVAMHHTECMVKSAGA